MNKKILSVLQVLGHPRDSKRISILMEEGFDVEAIAFERDYHSGRLPDCKIESLGKVENGKYLKRLFKIILAMPKLRRAMKRNDAIYASGQDMAAMAYIAGIGLNKPIILEVGDIVDMQLANNFLGKTVRAVEKFFVSNYGLLVVISSGFLDVYYRKWLNIKINAQVIENKLESSFYNTYSSLIKTDSDEQVMPLNGRPMRIGYFGLLRDEWSWNILESLAARYPEEYEIVFAGLVVNPKDLPARVSKYKNMNYKGEYRSPQDLPSLYNSIDMVWACYPKIKENDWNLKWGRPNRFFESCFFNKPTFARAGSHFAEDVKKFEIGKIIHHYETDSVLQEIRDIQSSQYKLWLENLNKLEQEVYLYTNENKVLSANIRSLIK